MKEGDQLILLTLDLEIPGLWENYLVEKFPESKFIIQNAYPSVQNSFSGLLKIQNANLKKIQNTLSSNYSSIKIDSFHPESNLFFYFDPTTPIAESIREIDCVLSWPIKFRKDVKRIKIVLKEKNVEPLISSIEKRGVDVIGISKIRINFDFNEILTPKQKEILEPSLKLGYYQFPKQISLNRLAKELKISPSTLCVHLQKIESKILSSNHSDLFFRSLIV